MNHHTKTKGDIAVAKTILDLTLKGYPVFSPLFSEHLQYDLIVEVDKKLLRLQVKYRADGILAHKTSWADKNGSHQRKYEKNDFDYYALYLPTKDVVVYPSIDFAGKVIATEIPTSIASFYWYEDFLTFTNQATKKTYKDFGYTASRNKEGLFNQIKMPSKEEIELVLKDKTMEEASKVFGVCNKTFRNWAKNFGLLKPRNNNKVFNLSAPKDRKVIWPTKEELETLIWQKTALEISKQFKVSNSTVSKWCSVYGIKKPGMGFWNKRKILDDKR